jgi:hypothetical protein
MSLSSPRRTGRGRILITAAVAAVVGLVSVPGCSKSPSTNVSGGKMISSSEAHDLLTEAKAGVSKVKSVRVAGLIVAGGSAMTVDLGLAAASAGGTVEVNGAKAEVRVINGQLYLKGGAEFWDALKKGVGAGFGDSWVKASAHTGPQFAALLDLVPATSALDRLAPGNSSWTTVLGRKLDGADTVGVRDTASGHGNTMYISKNKPPKPLGIELSKGGLLSFKSWGAAVKAPAVPAESVLDASDATLDRAVLPQN